MKKNNRFTVRTLLPVLLILITITAISGCQQETIFSQIEDETELEDAVIKGSVFSIVAFKDKIYATDGRIYAKAKNVLRGWAEVTSPSGNIIKLAANSTYLYALNSESELFYSDDAADWTEIDDWSGTLGSITTIFSDNNGNAYVKGKAKGNDTESFFTLSEATIAATTAVTSHVVEAGNTADSKTYTLDGSKKTVSDGTNTTTLDAEVYSLTYSPKADCLYAGTAAGVKKLTLKTDGTLTGSTADVPGSNVSSTLKSYETYAVYATKYTLDTTSYEAVYATTVMTGSTYSKVNGLWGYYESRGTWNRE
ncbi:hypothetical protein [Treponema brennaborense]|uniref:Lipoprotein n=1 Tax=Treponema brennaborense (strain DSM 12168 / CIP 105900 / DD5/3) TaxID=906968 RepID=F4LPX4_TREBD|nr:hypothetical protein [Treponema brennaborense]AEE16066.1 hypothetical protein Trebr_0624 [Treponema brennaborense DSM 12168]